MLNTVMLTHGNIHLVVGSHETGKHSIWPNMMKNIFKKLHHVPTPSKFKIPLNSDAKLSELRIQVGEKREKREK